MELKQFRVRSLTCKCTECNQFGGQGLVVYKYIGLNERELGEYFHPNVIVQILLAHDLDVMVDQVGGPAWQTQAGQDR